MRGVGLLGALLLAAALAACGPDEPPAPPPSPEPTQQASSEPPASPAELLALATQNTWGAASKRVTGTVELAAAGQTKTFDYVLVGELARGTQTDVAPVGSSVMEVVKIGDDVYIKTGEPFWQWYVSLAHLQFVVGKWVKARYEDYPSTVPVATELTPSPRTGVTEAGTDVVHGTPVVVLTDGDGNRYFVDDYPYLLRFEGSQATEVGAAEIVVEFSQLDSVADVIAAPTGEIVDLYHLPTYATGHD
jgi:hypothetical protein